MKIGKTIAWGVVLILLMIATFQTYAQFNTLTKMYYSQGSYDWVFKYIFGVPGYLPLNIALIGAYIIKLVEIWGKKDE